MPLTNRRHDQLNRLKQFNRASSRFIFLHKVIATVQLPILSSWLTVTSYDSIHVINPENLQLKYMQEINQKLLSCRWFCSFWLHDLDVPNNAWYPCTQLRHDSIVCILPEYIKLIGFVTQNDLKYNQECSVFVLRTKNEILLLPRMYQDNHYINLANTLCYTDGLYSSYSTIADTILEAVTEVFQLLIQPAATLQQLRQEAYKENPQILDRDPQMQEYLRQNTHWVIPGKTSDMPLFLMIKI